MGGQACIRRAGIAHQRLPSRLAPFRNAGVSGRARYSRRAGPGHSRRRASAVGGVGRPLEPRTAACHGLAMRRPPAHLACLALAACAALAACKPGGVGKADQLCARAAAMYDRCESRDGMTPQQWELVIDRWRGLCRAALTGETRQLLPDGAAIWRDMPDEVKVELREQAVCAAEATACPQYAACEK